jgi:large subunit ribosomal protein L15
MIHEITKLVRRNKRPTRKGRGESSGQGKTSGKGNKGAKARTGTYIKRGHEGGQTPIFRRFPKRGFSNHDFENRFYIVNVQDLNVFDDGAAIDALAMKEKGLVPDLKQPVKILGYGILTRKLTVQAGWYSKSAHAAIAAAGGAAQTAAGGVFEFPKEKKKFIPREPVKKKVEAEGDAPAKPAEAGAKAPEAAAKAATKPAAEAPAAPPVEPPSA